MAGRSIIGVYDTLAQAEEAIGTLDRGGFPIRQVSIVASDLTNERKINGYVTVGDVATQGAGTGAWLGSLFGLLVGAAFIWVPGFGPLVVAGPLAAVIAGGVEGAVAGAAGGGLLGALVGWGVSKEHVLKYEENLKGGKYLLVANGSSDEVARGAEILRTTAPAELTQRDMPADPTAPTTSITAPAA
jgi:hypothetical protein